MEAKLLAKALAKANKKVAGINLKLHAAEAERDALIRQTEYTCCRCNVVSEIGQSVQVLKYWWDNEPYSEGYRLDPYLYVDCPNCDARLRFDDKEAAKKWGGHFKTWIEVRER